MYIDCNWMHADDSACADSLQSVCKLLDLHCMASSLYFPDIAVHKSLYEWMHIPVIC